LTQNFSKYKAGRQQGLKQKASISDGVETNEFRSNLIVLPSSLIDPLLSHLILRQIEHGNEPTTYMILTTLHHNTA